MAARNTPGAGAKPDKLWRDALMVALKRPHEDEGDGRTKLAVIAERCVEAAVGGDMQAIKEIGDRVDGKPKQQTELTGADGEALLTGIDVRVIPSASRTA